MKLLLEKTTTYFFSLTVIALATVLGIYFYNIQSVKTSNDLVEHTQEVLFKSNTVLLNVIDIETGTRGFILTGNKSYLEPYISAKKSAKANLIALQLLTKDEPNQQIRINDLERKVNEKLNLNQQLIALRRNKNQKVFDFDKGKRITDSIRTLITNINNSESVVLKQQKNNSHKTSETSEMLFGFLFFFIAVITILIFYVFKKHKNKSDELVVANKELLYQSVEKQNRADELDIANIELAHQQSEKQNRVEELKIATIELDFQKNIAQQQAYSRSLIEASRDPLVTINTQGKIMDMNQALLKVIDKKREEVVDTDFCLYFTNKEKAEDVYKQVFEKGFVTNYSLTMEDGKLTEVLFNGSVYKDQSGKVIGAVVVARDITLQKALEKELTEAKVFAEHATSIAEKATIVANESVKSKQQFLSNMSHEIRTPMNAIIGFTKVVLKTDLTAKQKEYLTAIKMSGDALIVLINDILDLAKVDAGKMTFEKTPFKLKLSIKAMLHLFETKIQEKNLELITNYDPNIPEVLVGDPVRLHQIILNLVSNAVKFTNKGKITVSVFLVSENEQKVTIKFSVADTGIGIKDTKIEKVFENFQQATSGTSRIFGGTGLGLAIVKQLVEAQNGKIEIESEVNKGSTFSFSLDFKKTKADAVLEPEILQLNTDIKDIKILVAEDMELNQLLMKTLLDDFGFECEIAGNGKIAIEKLQTKTYDIILMDLQMPEMNGFEATQYIRETMKIDIPIIALTADVTTVDVAKCKEVGMNDYISKPVDERLLYSKLISVIKKPVLIIEEKRDGNAIIEKVKYVDMSYLIKLTKSNPELMSEMISVYLKQTPPLVRTMKQSFLDKDWQLLQATIHKILPSFTIMGISPEIAEVAKKIQYFAHKLELSEGLDQLIDQIEKACNQTFIELEIELTNLNKNIVQKEN